MLKLLCALCYLILRYIFSYSLIFPLIHCFWCIQSYYKYEVLEREIHSLILILYSFCIFLKYYFSQWIQSYFSRSLSNLPSLSLNLKHVLFLPNYPFNLISLSQLRKSSNCSITFDVNSFVIHEFNTCWLICEGHKSRKLYYLGTRLSMSCLTSPSAKLLHDRLGCPHLSKLKRVVW